MEIKCCLNRLLSYNKLRCVEKTSFSGLKNLRMLSLHENELGTLGMGTFSDLDRLVHLSIGYNAWHCDCNLKWLADLLKMRMLEPGIAACQSPAQMTRKTLLSTPASDFLCPPTTGTSNVNAKQIDAYSELLRRCNACTVSEPCQNRGRCLTSQLSSMQFTCECAPGFHGARCELAVDACSESPCLVCCPLQPSNLYIFVLPYNVSIFKLIYSYIYVFRV